MGAFSFLKSSNSIATVFVGRQELIFCFAPLCYGLFHIKVRLLQISYR